MQGMRAMLRQSLGRSLRTLPEEDRLAAALPVVCGSALASHCAVAELDAQRILHLRVSGESWLGPLLAMRDVLERDLAQTSGVVLHGLELRLTPAAGTPARVPKVTLKAKSGLRSTEAQANRPYPPSKKRKY